MTSHGPSVNKGEPTAKMLSESLAGSVPAILRRSSRTFASVGVAVGDVRLSVSEISPAMSSPARGGSITMPCWLFDKATNVLGEPTGLFQNRIGTSALKLASRG